ncbi:hypothetical protein DTO212C5_3765 [Paecilomyces variotii]|nr:hypothetical protein DTO212C5_3765 [Paecilomyces variotii]
MPLRSEKPHITRFFPPQTIRFSFDLRREISFSPLSASVHHLFCIFRLQAKEKVLDSSPTAPHRHLFLPILLFDLFFSIH